MAAIVLNDAPNSVGDLSGPPSAAEINPEQTTAPMRLCGIHVSGVPALTFRVGAQVSSIDIGDPGGDLVMVRIQRGPGKKALFFMADPKLLVTEYEVTPVVIVREMPRIKPRPVG